MDVITRTLIRNIKSLGFQKIYERSVIVIVEIQQYILATVTIEDDVIDV